jgi:hypothetical protein
MKEQDCFNYEPGDVQIIDIDILSNYLSRNKKADMQARTDYRYIYASDNLLMGR